MICPKCHIKMTEQKRTFHKQRKWVCPKCGRKRFQQLKDHPKRGSRSPHKSASTGRS